VGSQKAEVSVPAKPRLHVENFSRNSPKFGQNSKLLQKDMVFFTRVSMGGKPHFFGACF
jgi:hypothetical protein